MDDEDDLYKAHDAKSGPAARLDRTALHPHPHGDEQARAERNALKAAVAAKKAEAAHPAPALIPQAPRPQVQAEDHQGRRPEARSNFITLATWHNSVIFYAKVKTEN